MDEDKQEGKDPEPGVTTPAEDEGVQSETDSLIAQSNKASERAEKVVEALRKENDRAEKIAVKNQLEGKSFTAQASKTPTLSREELAAKERIMAVGRATGAKWAKEEDVPGMVK